MDQKGKAGSQKADMAEPAGREYVRTDDRIPVYYELLPPGSDAPQTVDWDLMFDDLEPKPEENPRLYELLFDINQKLNMLVNHMVEKNGFNLPEALEVNISGGGLRFYCNEQFKVGDVLMLKTFLPTYAHVIKIKCSVLQCENRVDGGGYELNVKYLDMDEAVRDKIIRYIFSRQRKILRNKEV